MLFVVMLGGRHPRASIEVHDVVFALADSLEETHAQLRNAWFGSPKGLHIDSWLEVDGVDGYRLEMAATPQPPGAPRLFFINLGGYEPHAFGEAHQYLLVVARDKAEAKAKGKRRLAAHWDKAHTDALHEVDDCIPIDHVAGRYIRLVQGESRGMLQRSDYILLS
ncbi:DUF1543 domain-containing protein [Pseudomonas panipatensis]|jgi:hypothetical protein|uniref:DUF1543 domain-containing protein n=1 Tax=Pseudomonas panipatensis TaxID=428992 RepID=A0A1G8GM46_9PSED|nr:DUF1543 domain-containing protein [Pseudomonas panipatensis]SDH95442.1 protein of unknown function [Pseudomonas panipatensis]SMP42505.1 protein of unknown function [Pseudomonas panipatensis]